MATGTELIQLKPPVAVRGPHHGDVASDAVEPDDAVYPLSLDSRLALELQTKFSEERDRSREVEAPGVAPPLTNLIGDPADARAGLAVLKIAYSDGSDGVLVVSCHLVGSPDSIFEGITASKGFVDYFDPVPPAPGVDANRTLFMVDK